MTETKQEQEYKDYQPEPPKPKEPGWDKCEGEEYGDRPGVGGNVTTSKEGVK